MINRRTFFSKTLPTFATLGSIPSLLTPTTPLQAQTTRQNTAQNTEQNISETNSIEIVNIDYEDYAVIPYTTERYETLSKNTPVIVVIDDNTQKTKTLFETLFDLMQEKPNFALPVLGLKTKNIETENQDLIKEWDPQPGMLVIIQNGFIEARRTDTLSKTDLEFLLNAVLMDEFGKG